MNSRLFGLSVVILAGFSLPSSAGTIFVADYGSIYKLSSGGTLSTFGSAGTTNIGMAFDLSGDLFVASRDNNTIYKYTPAGVQSVFATINSPVSLAVDSLGDVFTGSNGNIYEYSPGGSQSVFATGLSPDSLAIDPSNGLLFDGDNSGNIYEFSTTGVRSTFASGLPFGTFGMTFDQSGDMYASDWNGEISKFTPGGTRSIFATFSSQTLPTGLAYDNATNRLFMTEVANGISNYGQQVVDVFSSTGAMSTFATGLYVPYGIADLQPATTPEPSGFVMLGSGLALIAFRRARR